MDFLQIGINNELSLAPRDVKTYVETRYHRVLAVAIFDNFS